MGLSVMNPGDIPGDDDNDSSSRNVVPEAPKPAPKEVPAPEPEPDLMDEEDAAKRKRKKDAAEEKAKGNTHYKNKEFGEAIRCYDAAIALDDSDISFLTNRSVPLLHSPLSSSGPKGLGGEMCRRLHSQWLLHSI
jgi:stress-induced-phosphoprotein 1